MLTSAVSSTSAVATGATAASVVVAVLLFSTLVFKEYAFLSRTRTERYRRTVGAVVGALGVAFLLNIFVQTAALA